MASSNDEENSENDLKSQKNHIELQAETINDTGEYKLNKKHLSEYELNIGGTHAQNFSEKIKEPKKSPKLSFTQLLIEAKEQKQKERENKLKINKNKIEKDDKPKKELLQKKSEKQNEQEMEEEPPNIEKPIRKSRVRHLSLEKTKKRQRSQDMQKREKTPLKNKKTIENKEVKNYILKPKDGSENTSDTDSKENEEESDQRGKNTNQIKKLQKKKEKIENTETKTIETEVNNDKQKKTGAIPKQRDNGKAFESEWEKELQQNPKDTRQEKLIENTKIIEKTKEYKTLSILNFPKIVQTKLNFGNTHVEIPKKPQKTKEVYSPNSSFKKRTNYDSTSSEDEDGFKIPRRSRRNKSKITKNPTSTKNRYDSLTDREEEYSTTQTEGEQQSTTTRNERQNENTAQANRNIKKTNKKPHAHP